MFVVHAPAVFDVVKDARYGVKYQSEDGEPLRNKAYNDIAELIAHAELQRRGFTINPH